MELVDYIPKSAFWPEACRPPKDKYANKHGQKGASQPFSICTASRCLQELEVRHQEQGYKTR